MLFVVILLLQLCFVSYVASMEEQVKQGIESKSIQEAGRPLYGQPECMCAGPDAKSHLLAFVKYLYEKQGMVLLGELPNEIGHAAVTGDTGGEGECLRKQKPKLFKLIESKSSLDEIKKEIEAGADVNEEYNYSTPLNTAVRVGDISLVNLLISARAQINKGVGADKAKPITHAIRRNDYSMVSLLLSSGAKVNSSFFHIFTPLYEAISKYKICYEYGKESERNASFAIIQLLLQHNAKIEWPVLLNTYGESEKERFASIIKEAHSALDAKKQIIVYKSPEAVLFGKN